jgi:hypothetical protein
MSPFDMGRRGRTRLSIAHTETPNGTPSGTDVWFEVALGGTWEAAPWRVAYRLLPQDGEIVVAELRVFPHLGSPGFEAGSWNVESDIIATGGITARLMRTEVVVGRHVFQLLPEFWFETTSLKTGRSAHELTIGPFAQLLNAWLGRLGYHATPGRRPSRCGPKGRTDGELAQMAEVYVAACESGEATPVKIVAEAFGVAPSSARDALHRARKVGVLTRAGIGRAGGQLTKYGRSLLRAKPVETKKKGR